MSVQSKKKEAVVADAPESVISLDADEISLSVGGDENEGNQSKKHGGLQKDTRKDNKKEKEEKTDREFEEKLLEVRKVTKVTTGGRRLGFRATVLVGDKKGKIGLGVGKGSDVTIAVKKATHAAYKNIVSVRITKDGSVLYPVVKKFKSCIVKIIPAAPGTGLKAGSTVRSVLELAGYKNVLSKIVGTNNGLNNALVTLQILNSYKVKESHKAHVLEVDTKKVVNPHALKEQKKNLKTKKSQTKNAKAVRTQRKNNQGEKRSVQKEGNFRKKEENLKKK